MDISIFSVCNALGASVILTVIWASWQLTLGRRSAKQKLSLIITATATFLSFLFITSSNHLIGFGAIGGLVVSVLLCGWLDSEDSMKAIVAADEAACDAWCQLQEYKEKEAQEEFEAMYKQMMAKNPSKFVCEPLDSHNTSENSGNTEESTASCTHNTEVPRRLWNSYFRGSRAALNWLRDNCDKLPINEYVLASPDGLVAHSSDEAILMAKVKELGLQDYAVAFVEDARIPHQ